MNVLLILAMAQVTRGEEVEVVSGAVTALSCAIAAKESGNLEALNECPYSEATKEIVIFDVAEKQIYRVSTKMSRPVRRNAVHRFELEKAFGGGSIDFTGVVVAVDPKTEVATDDVAEYSVMARPKAGAFKGCL